MAIYKKSKFYKLFFARSLRDFIAGRTRLYDPDRNNFALRVGIAYQKDFFGRGNTATIFRAGYGVFYDQILGAVVSQSRNVFPSFLTINLAGGNGNINFENPQGLGALSILPPYLKPRGTPSRNPAHSILRIRC